MFLLYNSEDLSKMTKLTKNDILHLAALSGLNLTQKEVGKLSSDLSSVIGFFEELKKVDTKNVSPTSQTTGLENVTREDEIDVFQSLSAEDALYNGRDTKNGFFKVPIVLKK